MCNFNPLINKKNQELTLFQIKNFINENYKYRPSIFISGGEPFLRKDIFEIIKYIKSKKLICGICTNGSLLDKKKINSLIKLKLDYIIFSLHGPKNIHSKIVNNKNAFDKLIKNINYYVKQKCNNQKVIINCAVTNQNIYYLEEVMKISNSLRVDLLIFQHLSYTVKNDISKHNSTNHYSKNRIINYVDNITDYSHFYKELLRINSIANKAKIKTIFKPNLDKLEIKNWYSKNFKSKRKCYFLWGASYIYPNGDVYPCQYIEKPVGNILNNKFLNIWNNDEYKKFRSKIKKGILPFCSRCCKL